MTAPRWQPDELERLEDLAGDMPFELLCRSYNGWAAQAGRPLRSRSAIDHILKRRGISRWVIGDFVTTGTIHRILGLDQMTPRRWIESGWITSRQAGPGRWHYVRRADLVKLAMERPHVFGGASRAQIVQLLEDERLADRIAARFPRRWAHARPVRMVSTGRRYPSLHAAAADHAVSHQAIRRALRTGGTCAGSQWKDAGPIGGPGAPQLRPLLRHRLNAQP
jgi:hypothetical protein